MSPFRLTLPGEDLTVDLALPVGVRARTSEAIDLSAVPGAEVIGRKSWVFGEGGRLEFACVRLPIEQWIPGLEHTLLAGATALVREQLSLRTVSNGPLEMSSGAYWASFEGRTNTAKIRTAHGRHIVGFVGQPPSLTLCSSACVAGDEAGTCSDVVHGMTVNGTFVPPPPPGLGLRLLLRSAEHPSAVLAFAMALAIGVVTLLLWRRPRPAH